MERDCCHFAKVVETRKARGIVRVWKVMRGERVCDNNIKKRSQLAAVTVYLLYWFV